MSAKKFGIVFPSEVFESKEAAMKYAEDMLNDDEISKGLYVFEATEMTHLKVKKSIVRVVA